MIEDFEDLLTQTIWRHPVAGVDGYGKATYKPRVEHLCHIDGRSTTTTAGTGAGQVAYKEGTVYLDGYYPDASEGDLIELPDGTKHATVEIAHPADEDGPDHTVISYGATAIR